MINMPKVQNAMRSDIVAIVEIYENFFELYLISIHNPKGRQVINPS